LMLGDNWSPVQVDLQMYTRIHYSSEEEIPPCFIMP
jgi:hypothetical protein